ncbi:hypothetical protein LQW54_006905 [Pestalotiopsis sp. IQ-011]
MVTKGDIKLLNESIDKADVVILRQVLKWMCESSEECYNQAAKHLVVPAAAAGAKRNSDQDAQADASKKSKTAPTSKFEKCVTCEKTFDVTSNCNDACQTHDDILDVDLDYFPDDDEVQDGAIEPYTDWRRKESPKGFIWQCCERNIDEKPCRIQRHFSAAKAKKAKDEGIDLYELAKRYKAEPDPPIEISSDED